MSIDFNKPIQTVDGRAVRILSTDRKDKYGFSIVALVTGINGSEQICAYKNDGKYANIYNSGNDLVNVKTKHVGYMNVYPAKYKIDHRGGDIYKDRDTALSCRLSNAVDTIKIEWEE